MKKIFWYLLIISSFTYGQRDSLRFKDQIFLELSAGPGYYDTYKMYFFHNLSINVASRLMYKNHRFKAGAKVGGLLVWSTDLRFYYSFDAGINFLAKRDYPHYFGPSVGYGYFFNTGNYSLGHRFFSLGIDYNYKKFYVSLTNQFIAFENQKFPNTEYGKTHNLFLELGYSFRLFSSKKK